MKTVWAKNHPEESWSFLVVSTLSRKREAPATQGAAKPSSRPSPKAHVAKFARSGLVFTSETQSTLCTEYF